MAMILAQRAWRDLNPRPSEPESDALSTELHALIGLHYNMVLLKLLLLTRIFLPLAYLT